MSTTPYLEFPKDEPPRQRFIDPTLVAGVVVVVILIILWSQRKGGLVKTAISLPPPAPPLVSPWNPLP